MSSVSANTFTFPDFTFPDFFENLSKLAKPSPKQLKELQAKKITRAKRAKIISKQRKIDKKEAEKQAKIDKKEAEKQAKIDKKEAQKQAKIDKKEAQKQAKKQAKIDKKELEKQAKKQAKIDKKELEKQAKIDKKEEQKLIVKAKKTLVKADKIIEDQEREDLVNTIMKKLGPNVGNIPPTLKEWDSELLIDDDNYLYDVTDRKKIGKVVDVDNAELEFFD